MIATSYARYDPSKGYYWEFPNDPSSENSSNQTSKPKHEEPNDTQRKRVDILLGDLVKKFPPKAFARKVYKVCRFTVFCNANQSLFVCLFQDGGKPVVGK